MWACLRNRKSNVYDADQTENCHVENLKYDWSMGKREYEWEGLQYLTRVFFANGFNCFWYKEKFNYGDFIELYTAEKLHKISS